ncbi:MAG: polymer-forming cytoskeletal protein [Deltaproteobacteria bacterium]|nr:MAG: polymer-forming cytoskeletal protein [Deltaproteobacteria bacterium]
MDSRKTDTFIGQESEFTGKLTFDGTLRIDGRLTGEIFSPGTLIIGPAAQIEAEIRVGTAVIAGHVNGDVYAEKEVELKAPAQLTGNIHTPSLVVQRGALFKGTCFMEQRQEAPDLEEIEPVKSEEIIPPPPPSALNENNYE